MKIPQSREHSCNSVPEGVKALFYAEKIREKKGKYAEILTGYKIATRDSGKYVPAGCLLVIGIWNDVNGYKTATI